MPHNPPPLRQRGAWLPADTQTPISLYLHMVQRKPGILLESSEVDGRLGRYSLIAWDFRLVLSCAQGRLAVRVNDPRLEPLRELHGLPFLEGVRAAQAAIAILPPEAGLPAMTRSLIGYFGYTSAGLWELAVADILPPHQADACLVLPGRQILFDHLRHRCLTLALEEDPMPPICGRPLTPEPPRLGPVSTIPDREQFLASVRRTKEAIQAGEAIQVVLSTRFSASFSGSPFEVYRTLRRVNPSPYTFYMALSPDFTLLGSSPELLVRSQKGRLELRPIAGTRPRGATVNEDEALAQELLADEKERAEHVMLVDLGRNDLGRVAAPGSVQVDATMEVERFSHVMHLTSYLSATLKPGLTALDVLAAVFPAGTVSGAPKIRAMQLIHDEESLPRGPYAGCIGWIGLGDEAADMDTGITIRSLWVQGGQIHWQAGAGIVFDSDPEKEWQECHNKARAILTAVNETGGSDVFADRQL